MEVGVYCEKIPVESVRLILNQYNMGKRIEDATEMEIERSNKWVIVSLLF